MMDTMEMAPIIIMQIAAAKQAFIEDAQFVIIFFIENCFFMGASSFHACLNKFFILYLVSEQKSIVNMYKTSI